MSKYTYVTLNINKNFGGHSGVDILIVHESSGLRNTLSEQ